jgi:5-methylcytosine-specific restriction endonuclease McrA
MVCTKCNIEKTIDMFFKDVSKKSGVKPYCKDCDKKYIRSTDAILRGRIKSKGYVTPNKADNDKRYRLTELGRVNKFRCKSKRRNAIGQHTLSSKELNKIYNSFENKCAYCNSTDNITLDHVIPVSKGGNTTIDNIILACRSCNCKRGNKDLCLFVSEEKYKSINKKIVRL